MKYQVLCSISDYSMEYPSAYPTEAEAIKQLDDAYNRTRLATRYRDGTEYYDIRVLVPVQQMTTRRDVENLILTCAQGDPLRIRDIAQVVPASGPVEIIRENQTKQVTAEADIAGNDLAGVVRELRATLAKIDRPTGYEFDFGERAEMMADMKETVLAVLAFAVFFSFIGLTVQFNSIKLPAIILGSAPICLTGVVFLMYITQLPLGATVIIGILVIVAATVNDSVLLLTYPKKVGAENFSRLRRIALNLLKQEKTAKCGIKAKQHKAGWDEQYMIKVL